LAINEDKTSPWQEGEEEKPKAKPGFPKTLILDALAVVALLSLLFIVGWSGDQTQNPGVAAPPAQPPQMASKPPGAPPASDSTAADFAVMASAQESSPPAPKPAAPAKISDSLESQEPLEQMLSRPVGKDASEEEAVKKSSGKPKTYRIRFAVCESRISCQNVQDRLRSKKISSRLEKAGQRITVFHVALGPWPTLSHANEASHKLSGQGLATSVLGSQGKTYLVTSPRFFKKDVEKDQALAKAAGYEGKIFSRYEIQEMFKVYGETFKDQASARKRLDFYRKKGLDCLIEEG